MKFTIHYTDNARAANRGGGYDSIDDYEFEGTLNEVLNFAAYSTHYGLYDLDEDDWRGAVEEGEWDNLSDKEATDSLDGADLGSGSPIIFWIDDENGNRIYDSGLNEEEWEDGDDD